MTQFLWTTSWFFSLAHVLIPLAAIVLVVWPANFLGLAIRNRSRISILIALFIGGASGVVVASIYLRTGLTATTPFQAATANLIPFELPPAYELVKAAWLGAGLVLLMRFFDDGVRSVLLKIDRKFHRRADLNSSMEATDDSSTLIDSPHIAPAQIPSRPYARLLRLSILNSVRLIFLLGFVLPYAMAAVVTYRPHVFPVVSPASALRLPSDMFETPRSLDSPGIVGYFIPAAVPTEQCVIICHGQGVGMADSFALAGFMHDAGLNVAVFDFRGFGQSDGLRSTFGFAEAADLRNVVNLLRSTRFEQTRTLFAIGTDTGASAIVNLLRNSPDSPFQGVALIKPFLSLDTLGQDLGKRSFVWPLGGVLPWMTVRYAALQTGEPLYQSPKTIDLWPTPALVLHDLRDGYVPIERSMEFFSALSPPKRNSWRSEIDPRQAYLRGIETILIFFADTRLSGPVV